MTSDSLRPGLVALPQRWTQVLRALDPRVLVPALALSAVGLVALAADRPEIVVAQARWTAVGMALCVATVVLPYRRMLALVWPGYALTLLALVAVLLFGRTANNAQRWLQLGPFGFQPSEIAKVAVIGALAVYIRFRQDHRTFKGLFVPFAITFVPLLLIVKQPDLGTALMLVPVLFVMLWAAGARTRHLATVVLLGVASLPLLWTVALKPYQKERILSMAVVEDVTGVFGGQAAEEAQGREETHAERVARLLREQEKRDAQFHVQRSQIAVAAGGWTGAGFREGVMNRTDAVPESWTDFVFTVYAEEWGFLGVVVLVLLEAGLLLGLATTAREVKEPAARLLAVGAMTLFGVQACVNLAMTVGLAPVTGLPLPFLSYGGSSMLCSWLLIGLALNARAHKPVVFTERDFD